MGVRENNALRCRDNDEPRLPDCESRQQHLKGRKGGVEVGTDPGDYTRGTKWLTEFFGVGSEKRCCRASGAVDGRDKNSV